MTTNHQVQRDHGGAWTISDEDADGLRRPELVSTPVSEAPAAAGGVMDLLEIALGLARQGPPVFPCGANKKPCIAKAAGGNGFQDASTDGEAIVRLFSVPGARLIGVPTGEPSDIDVLDIDYRHGAGAWEDANLFRLPETRIHGSRSGGRHYLFRHVHGVRNSQSEVGPGVDVRGTGGYIIWWPAHGRGLISEAPVSDWPEWLREIVHKRRITPAPTPCPIGVEMIPAGRLATLIEASLARVHRAAEGAKHVRLRNEALFLGGVAQHAGFTDADAVEMLLNALPATVKDRKNARGTAEWGVKRGRERPIILPAQRAKASGDDNRRSQTTRMAFETMRCGPSGQGLRGALIAHNAQRPDPLPAAVVDDTADWVLKAHAEARHDR